MKILLNQLKKKFSKTLKKREAKFLKTWKPRTKEKKTKYLRNLGKLKIIKNLKIEKINVFKAKK
jgi:hypothetical protein